MKEFGKLKAALRKAFNGIFPCVILVFLLSSCEKDPEPEPLPNASGERVLVVCEGSLGNGNSALTLFEPDSNRTTDDVFKQVNGIPLGDVFQSIARIDDRYFLCINNSDRIYVINRADFRLQGSISVPKPRYVLQVSPTKAYVTSLFNNKVYIIDPSTLTVRGSIDMPFKNPEGLCLAGNKVFVATWDSACSVIYPIDTSLDVVQSPISVAGKAPQELLLDGEGKLWVMGGNQAQNVEATLSRIDPATGSLLKSYSFGKEDPVHPAFNKAKDTLYFIQVKYTPGASQSGVYRMGIHDVALPTQAFVGATGLQNFWGLGIHPKSGAVYIADPLGFTQRGRVEVYHPDGSFSNYFTTGVGPGHFLFD